MDCGEECKKLIENLLQTHGIDPSLTNRTEVFKTDWLFAYPSGRTDLVEQICSELNIDFKTYDENAKVYEYFYDQAKINNFDQIKFLDIQYIDRGFYMMSNLAKLLKLKFPNLEILKLEQNYSIATEPEDFLEFLQILGLKKIMITDSQSSFFESINSEQILNSMCDNSVMILYLLQKSPVETCSIGSKRLICIQNYYDEDEYFRILKS